MKLISFILKCAGEIRFSRTIIVIVTLSSIIAGVGSTLLIATINAALGQNGLASRGLIWSFIGICAGVTVIKLTSQILLEHLVSHATSNLRRHLCRQILSSPLRQLEEIGTSRVLATLTEDIHTIVSSLSSFPSLCTNIAIVLACLLYLGWLSWLLLVGVLIFIAVALTSYQLMLARGMHHWYLGRTTWEQLLQNFRALTEGNKELKLHHARRQDFLSRLLDPTIALLRRCHMAGATTEAVTRTWGQSLFFILIAILIFAVPAIKGTTAQTLTSFTLTLLYMIGPLDAITNAITGFKRNRIALQKVEDLGISLSASSYSEMTVATERPASWESLELSGITHSYRTDASQHPFTLGPLDLNFSPGEIVFLVGGNGCGKTTLLKLIAGLYVPEAGEIRLDGATIDEQTREQYRQYFSVVFSDFYLFESLLGMEALDLDLRAHEYLSLLQLDHKVRVQDGKLSTTELSQGQRKRLALLTAYLEDRPIYIFDEWAADQDPRFKEIFYLELLPELKARGKTAIIISHDDRYYYMADRVIKLEDGRVNYDEHLDAVSSELGHPLPGERSHSEILAIS